MNLQLTRGIRRWFFPESEKVAEGTKKIDQVIGALRGETTNMHKQASCLRDPDTLQALVNNMRTGKH